MGQRCFIRYFTFRFPPVYLTPILVIYRILDWKNHDKETDRYYTKKKLLAKNSITHPNITFEIFIFKLFGERTWVSINFLLFTPKCYHSATIITLITRYWIINLIILGQRDQIDNAWLIDLDVFLSISILCNKNNVAKLNTFQLHVLVTFRVSVWIRIMVYKVEIFLRNWEIIALNYYNLVIFW